MMSRRMMLGVMGLMVFSIISLSGCATPGPASTSSAAMPPADSGTDAFPPSTDPFPTPTEDPFAVHAGIPVVSSDGRIVIPAMDGEVGTPVVTSDGSLAIPAAPN
jgi:hypothetical protein